MKIPVIALLAMLTAAPAATVTPAMADNGLNGAIQNLNRALNPNDRQQASRPDDDYRYSDDQRRRDEEQHRLDAQRRDLNQQQRQLDREHNYRSDDSYYRDDYNRRGNTDRY